MTKVNAGWSHYGQEEEQWAGVICAHVTVNPSNMPLRVEAYKPFKMAVHFAFLSLSIFFLC